ncbi:hypothetical protein MAR_018810 [Mya arenaria]|uniref:Uncharacterized protein n=1 Tax=Mya arenaria TaxID=6604 RepID=A0ABY7EIU2_MYAAR|nr:hypothetical protein MAR_018810 [Mya arenaria]
MVFAKLFCIPARQSKTSLVWSFVMEQCKDQVRKTFLCSELSDEDVQDQVNKTRRRHVEAFFDVFDVSLNADNIFVFANASVDCILCLLKNVYEQDKFNLLFLMPILHYFDDLDKHYGILHVWFLPLEGVSSFPRSFQPRTMVKLFELLLAACYVPGLYTYLNSISYFISVLNIIYH